MRPNHLTVNNQSQRLSYSMQKIIVTQMSFWVSSRQTQRFHCPLHCRQPRSIAINKNAPKKGKKFQEGK
jgi:hypothetical protein